MDEEPVPVCRTCAYNYYNEEVKILQGLANQRCEGCGKTFIGEDLSKCKRLIDTVNLMDELGLKFRIIKYFCSKCSKK